ncbi:MAG: hypothetical protein AB1452_03280 [Pseudomonadota bacterium]
MVASRGVRRRRPKRRPLWTREDKAIVLRRLRRLSGYSPYLAALILPGGLALVPLIAWWRRRSFSRGSSRNRC